MHSLCCLLVLLYAVQMLSHNVDVSYDFLQICERSVLKVCFVSVGSFVRSANAESQC